MDILNVGSSLDFSAINLFGALGSKPLFTFYSSDEFTHAITVSTAFPRGEIPSWRVQSGLGMHFQGFAGASLDTRNTLTLAKGAGSAGWIESIEADWTVPTTRSLLSLFYNFLVRGALTQSSWLSLTDLLNSEYEQFRKDTLTLALDRSSGYLAMDLTVGHESIIRIPGRLNFSVFAKFTFTDNARSELFSCIATIGTTLNVSF
jgi:hypothetical protein